MSAVDLQALGRGARENSERWFPAVHDERRALAPLAAHYALGLAGEAGEVANVAKKFLRDGTLTAMRRGQLRDEMADVFTYLLLLADELRVDLVEAFNEKQAECERRWGV